MAKRTWIRCKCGTKLHAKKELRQCFDCRKKGRKGKNVRI